MFYGHYPYILSKVLNRHFERIDFGWFQNLFSKRNFCHFGDKSVRQGNVGKTTDKFFEIFLKTIKTQFLYFFEFCLEKFSYFWKMFEMSLNSEMVSSSGTASNWDKYPIISLKPSFIISDGGETSFSFGWIWSPKIILKTSDVI